MISCLSAAKRYFVAAGRLAVCFNTWSYGMVAPRRPAPALSSSAAQDGGRKDAPPRCAPKMRQESGGLSTNSPRDRPAAFHTLG